MNKCCLPASFPFPGDLETEQLSTISAVLRYVQTKSPLLGPSSYTPRPQTPPPGRRLLIEPRQTWRPSADSLSSARSDQLAHGTTPRMTTYRWCREVLSGLLRVLIGGGRGRPEEAEDREKRRGQRVAPGRQRIELPACAAWTPCVDRIP